MEEEGAPGIPKSTGRKGRQMSLLALLLCLLAHPYNVLKSEEIPGKKAVSLGFFVPFGTFLEFPVGLKYPGERGR